MRYDCCICRFAAISCFIIVFFDTLDVPDAVYWTFVTRSWMRPRAVAAHILLKLGNEESLFEFFIVVRLRKETLAWWEKRLAKGQQLHN
jgi:hypothetical protein